MSKSKFEIGDIVEISNEYKENETFIAKIFDFKIEFMSGVILSKTYGHRVATRLISSSRTGFKSYQVKELKHV